MASALQSALAVGLEVVLQSIGIRTLDDLASGIRDRGDEIADYITSSSCRRAALVAAQERDYESGHSTGSDSRKLGGHGGIASSDVGSQCS